VCSFAQVELRYEEYVMGRSLAGLIIIVGLLEAGLAVAADWPSWRGPTGMGQTAEKDLPLTWGGKNQDNVLWKVPLAENADKAKFDQNQSSPIVHGDRVFVTLSYWPANVAQDQYPEHHVICFQASDGKRLWDTVVPPGPWLLKDLRGGYTAPTPAGDEERVYVLFGSSVLAALDRQGKLVWRKEITPYLFDVAIGTSPVLYKDTVLVACEEMRDKKASTLRAFDRKTGDLAWEQKRPDADWTHSTPVLAEVNGKVQLLMASAMALQGLDPDNGKLLWWCNYDKRIGDTPSPVLGGGLVYVDSGRGGPGIAVDPSGSGDVTKTHLKWKIPQVAEGFSSAVIVGEHLYRVHNPGVLHCWELATGKEIYAERLEGVSTSASPIATADGQLYFASAGKSHVVKAGPTFEVLATNDLAEVSPASAAIANGRIYLKGNRSLFCIGKK
jgi:outer membrane protein assembly factor BamB